MIKMPKIRWDSLLLICCESCLTVTILILEIIWGSWKVFVRILFCFLWKADFCVLVASFKLVSQQFHCFNQIYYEPWFHERTVILRGVWRGLSRRDHNRGVKWDDSLVWFGDTVVFKSVKSYFRIGSTIVLGVQFFLLLVSS